MVALAERSTPCRTPDPHGGGRRWSRSLRRPNSAVPRIRSSWIFPSCSVTGCMPACYVAFHRSFAWAPPQLALGGDDHHRCEENDHGAEDQESCCVRSRHHIVGE